MKSSLITPGTVVDTQYLADHLLVYCRNSSRLEREILVFWSLIKDFVYLRCDWQFYSVLPFQENKARMALQRFAPLHLVYAIAIFFFNWLAFTQALALPTVPNIHTKSPTTAAASPSHGATSGFAVISNSNPIPPTRLLTHKARSSASRNFSGPPDISSGTSKFARTLTVSSISTGDAFSNPGSEASTQPANRSSATGALTPPQASSLSYPTTLRTSSIRPSTTTESTQPHTPSTSIPSPSASPPYPLSSASSTPLPTALPPQSLSLSLLIPLVLILAIIVILLSLLIRSSRPPSTPPRRRPRAEHSRASHLLEVPSTESTVVTCREVFELPGSMAWGGWEGDGERVKEFGAGEWEAEAEGG
ncbi:hypothetical protein MMC34_005932 [Xylographa carneopallida]|nr:hypothetical protein [Xylographa carneopallida]